MAGNKKKQDTLRETWLASQESAKWLRQFCIHSPTALGHLDVMQASMSRCYRSVASRLMHQPDLPIGDESEGPPPPIEVQQLKEIRARIDAGGDLALLRKEAEQVMARLNLKTAMEGSIQMHSLMTTSKDARTKKDLISLSQQAHGQLIKQPSTDPGREPTLEFSTSDGIDVKMASGYNQGEAK